MTWVEKRKRKEEKGKLSSEWKDEINNNNIH